MLGAQQLEIQRAAAEKHFGQRLFDVGQFDLARSVAFEMKLRRAPCQ
jgi:hypothetical protein